MQYFGGILNSNIVNTPMDPNGKLLPYQWKPLLDPKRYRDNW